MPIVVDIDVMPARRETTVGHFAERVEITPANPAVLRNGRAGAVRWCPAGGLLRWEADRV